MGVYSLDTHGATGKVQVEADTRYYGPAGARRIMAEAFQNDLTFFEGVIANDFATAARIQEGTLLESEMRSITEGTVSGFFAKLKELVKKIWAKIKGLVKNFCIKITAMCTGDNKKLVNKYKKEVVSKDLSKMKFKWSKRTKNDFPELSNEFHALAKESTVTAEEETEVLEKLLGTLIDRPSGVSADEFPKEIHEYMYDDPEEYEGLSDAGTSISEIIGILTNSSTSLKDIDKLYKDEEKALRDQLKELDREEKETIKRIPTDKTAEADLTTLHDWQRGINVCQRIYTMITNAGIAECKFSIAQCRRTFIKAATYNPKTVKEDAILVEACCEVSDNEIEDAIASAPTQAEKDAYDAAARNGEIDPTGDIGPQNGSI